MSKLFKRISAFTLATVVASTLAISASAEVKTFDNVTLGNYVMSGELDGSLYGGFATTRCNANVYLIHAAVEGYVIGDDGVRYDEKRAEMTNYDWNIAIASNGGHQPFGLRTGSFWSAHEIRDGQNGVGHYLATIDV